MFAASSVYANETANKQGTCTVIQGGGHNVSVNK
jgi:hypothetical protein